MPDKAPHYFYFMVNPSILEKVLDYTNDKHTGYGILSIDTSSNYHLIKSYRKAVLNKSAKKLSVKAMIGMVRNQSKSLVEEWKSIEQRIESKVNERMYYLEHPKVAV